MDEDHTTAAAAHDQTSQDISSSSSLQTTAPAIARTDSSSASSDDNNRAAHNNDGILAPTPTRPHLHSRPSNSTIIASGDSLEASQTTQTTTTAIDAFDPDDVRAMSPRRTSEDLEQLGRQTRDEVRKHAKILQDSLLMIFHRIQAVKEEHDKLDNNNKFLQKYIGDLMTTSKITSTGGGRIKK